MNQTVQHTRFITITQTQEVYSQTTVRICPTPSPSPSEDTHSMTPMVVTPTVSTVYITRYSDSIPTTKIAIVLSNVAIIGILATSGVLICLSISALVIVTCCWIRTRRTLKKRNEVKPDHSVKDR
jgi:hypothetical protein